MLFFCFLDSILSFSTFSVNEVTHCKPSFSASFSSNKTCNLLSIAKASPEFTADFESISIASSSLYSDSEQLSSGSTFYLVTDWIHLTRNSSLQSIDGVFTSGSQLSTQSSDSRNSSTVTSKLSPCKSSSNLWSTVSWIA